MRSSRDPSRGARARRRRRRVLGNRKMMLVVEERRLAVDPFVRLAAMTLGSLPIWILLGG